MSWVVRVEVPDHEPQTIGYFLDHLGARLMQDKVDFYLTEQGLDSSTRIEELIPGSAWRSAIPWIPDWAREEEP